MKTYPDAGEAASATEALFVTASEQSPEVPAPQAMPVPETEPLDGVGETVRVTRSSSIVTSASFDFSSHSCAPLPNVAEPFTFTVSPPSADESAVGVSVNVPDALREPPGIDSVKLPTEAKSVPSVAVPPFTFTFTETGCDQGWIVLPVSFASTETVRAPPSSGTDDGLAPKTTFGSHRTTMSLFTTAVSPDSACVTRRRYFRSSGVGEDGERPYSCLLAIANAWPQISAVSSRPWPGPGYTRYHCPDRLPPPFAFAEPVSSIRARPLPTPIDATPPFPAVSETAGAVFAAASSDQPLLPTLFLARTRTS